MEIGNENSSPCRASVGERQSVDARHRVPLRLISLLSNLIASCSTRFPRLTLTLKRARKSIFHLCLEAMPMFARCRRSTKSGEKSKEETKGGKFCVRRYGKKKENQHPKVYSSEPSRGRQAQDGDIFNMITSARRLISSFMRFFWFGSSSLALPPSLT